MIHFDHYTSVYEHIFTCVCWIISQNMSLSKILSQAIYWTQRKHNDPICPTISCFLYSSLLSLRWPSSTQCQSIALTLVLAESIWDHLLPSANPSALGFLVCQCHCHAQDWIHRLPPSCHHLRVGFPSYQAWQVQIVCRKCFQGYCFHHFQLGDR